MKPISGLARLIERWLTKERPPRKALLCDFERIRHELKSCDVLLIEGRSRAANVIRYITQSNWTHAALYIGRLYDIEDPKLRHLIRSHYNGSENEQLIIESELGIGTVIRSLKTYQYDHIRICRPKGIAHADCQQVIAYSLSQLGKGYYTRQIFDLMRFFLPYKALPPRLGSSLFKLNPGYATKTVCSSMIAEAFCFIQFPILPLVKMTGENNEVQLFQQNPKLCTPKDFDYSPYFQIIKYSFFDRSHHESYRLLPWSGSNQLSQDESGIYVTQNQLNTLKNLSCNAPQDDKDSITKQKEQPDST